MAAVRRKAEGVAKPAVRPYKATPGNIMRIFRALRETSSEGGGFVTVSEIARRAGLHKWTVSRTIDIYMGPLVEIVQPPELAALGLQVKLVKLKDSGLKPQQLISYLKLRRKIST
jgi:hypothetical protein